MGGGRYKIVKFCIPVLYYQLCTLYMHLLAWVNCTAGYSEVLAVQYLHLCTVSTSYHILASNLLNVHCKYLIILEVPYLFARGWECFFYNAWRACTATQDTHAPKQTTSSILRIFSLISLKCNTLNFSGYKNYKWVGEVKLKAKALGHFKVEAV